MTKLVTLAVMLASQIAAADDSCNVGGAEFRYTCPERPITEGICKDVREFSSSFIVPADGSSSWTNGVHRFRLDRGTCRVFVSRDGSPCPGSEADFDLFGLRGSVQAYCDGTCSEETRVGCRLERVGGPAQTVAATVPSRGVPTPILTSVQSMASLGSMSEQIVIDPGLRRTGQFEVQALLGMIGDGDKPPRGLSGVLLEFRQGIFDSWDEEGHGRGVELGLASHINYVFGVDRWRGEGARVTGIGRASRSWGRVGLGGHLYLDAQYWKGERNGDQFSIATEIKVEQTLLSFGPEAWISFGREPVFFGRFTVRALIGAANGFQGELHVATRGFDVRLIGEAARFANTTFVEIQEESNIQPTLSVSLAIGFRIPWGEDSQDRAAARRTAVR